MNAFLFGKLTIVQGSWNVAKSPKSKVISKGRPVVNLIEGYVL